MGCINSKLTNNIETEKKLTKATTVIHNPLFFNDDDILPIKAKGNVSFQLR